MTNYKNMLLVKGTVNWTGNKKATFKMIPLTNDCPFIEAVFDPEHMALGLVGKYKKESYDMVPTLDKNGDLQPKKKVVKPGEFPYMQEKRLIATWNEHEILTKEEILSFIEMFAINSKEFDVEFFFNPIKENTAPAVHKTELKMTATVTENEPVVN
jgi:hypothetical protein